MSYRMVLLAMALGGLVACGRVPNGPTPTSILGEWRMVLTRGGENGRDEPVPAGFETHVVFGPDSSYASYHNGRLVECTTFHLRYQPQPGGPGELQLFTKMANSLMAQPRYQLAHVTRLTASELQICISEPCPLYVHYERVAPTAKAQTPAPGRRGYVLGFGMEDARRRLAALEAMR